MSSTDGSAPVEKRPRRPTPTSTDPAVLAAEIERTREDLAETLDAIADRVSPKRVADRTRKQVHEAVATAKEVLTGQAGVAKGRAADLASGARDKAVEAREKVTGASGAHAGNGGSEPLASAGASSPGALPPVTAVQADGLDLSAPPTTAPTPAGTPSAPSVTPASGPSPEVLAGGALGLLVLLLLRRRRTRRRAARTGAVAALAAAGAGVRSDFVDARGRAAKKAAKARRKAAKGGRKAAEAGRKAGTTAGEAGTRAGTKAAEAGRRAGTKVAAHRR